VIYSDIYRISNGRTWQTYIIYRYTCYGCTTMVFVYEWKLEILRFITKMHQNVPNLVLNFKNSPWVISLNPHPLASGACIGRKGKVVERKEDRWKGDKRSRQNLPLDKIQDSHCSKLFQITTKSLS